MFRNQFQDLMCVMFGFALQQKNKDDFKIVKDDTCICSFAGGLLQLEIKPFVPHYYSPPPAGDRKTISILMDIGWFVQRVQRFRNSLNVVPSHEGKCWSCDALVLGSKEKSRRHDGRIKIFSFFVCANKECRSNVNVLVEYFTATFLQVLPLPDSWVDQRIFVPRKNGSVSLSLPLNKKHHWLDLWTYSNELSLYVTFILSQSFSALGLKKCIAAKFVPLTSSCCNLKLQLPPLNKLLHPTVVQLLSHFSEPILKLFPESERRKLSRPKIERPEVKNNFKAPKVSCIRSQKERFLHLKGE